MERPVIGAARLSGTQQPDCKVEPVEIIPPSPEHPGYTLVSAASGQVIAVASNSLSEDAPLIQYPHTEHPSQHWKFVVERHQDGAPLVQLVSLLSGKVISVGDASDAPGTPLVQRSYLGQDSQQWWVTDQQCGIFRITAVGSRMAMSALHADGKPGTPVVQRAIARDDTQAWAIRSAGDGRYELRLFTSQVKTLVVKDGSHQPDAPIVLGSGGFDTTDFWSLSSIEHGRFKIVSATTGLAISVAGKSHEPNAPLVQAEYVGDSSQQWDLVPLSPLQFFSNHVSLEVISVEHASRHAGAAIVQCPDDGKEWASNRFWELHLLTRNPWNPRIDDVRAAFESVPSHGHWAHYNGTVVPSLGHIQGAALYRHYYLLTHDRPGQSTGQVILIDKREHIFAIVNEFDSPLEGYNHPGGMQVIGDYLAMALETGDNDKGVVCFYYLGSMNDDRKPVLLPTRLTAKGGAGAVGITEIETDVGRIHLVAVYDNPSVTLYRSNGCSLEDAACDFFPVFVQDLNRGADNLGLVTDRAGCPFLIALTTDDSADWAELYRIDLPNRTLELVTSRHMYTEGGISGPLGIHFRWGAGLHVFESGALGFYCTARNLEPIYGVDMDYFHH